MRTKKHAPAMRSWKRRSGFTLVELLTVIAIIGILVGMIVPAVMFALTSVQRKALAMEVTTIAGAIDKYKEKYGDYPPDGSSATAMTRHLRKVFPQIAASELALVTPGAATRAAFDSLGLSGAVMDPPEALVFFLGGFSDDPVHPFTGAGGPFTATPAGSTYLLQYNVVRNAPLYDFNQGQLTLEVVNDPGSGLPVTLSSDEADFAPSSTIDLVPMYHHSGRDAPVVYFNSNTYRTAGGGYNYFQPQSSGQKQVGTARPFKSDELNTANLSDPDGYFRYAADKTYQVISAGIDDNFGGDPGNGTSFNFYRFPSGDSLNIFPTPAVVGQYPTYQVPGAIANFQLDNATNFSEGTLEDSMP